jgi:penicillin-binding protein 1B
MRDSGMISAGDYQRAVATELRVAPTLDPTDGHYLVDFIRGELLRDFPDSQLRTGGLQVFTTVDLQLQRAAVDAVRNGLRFVEQQLARKTRGVAAEPTSSPQAGLIALDPRTGAVKAMVGGAHYGSSQYNRVTVGFRQPGSIFKPFVYAAALETAMDATPLALVGGSGQLTDAITPLTLLVDAPASFPSPTGLYSPRNYGGEYSGIVTLRTAFERSLNVPAVKLAGLVGYDRVARFARRMGLNDRIQGYPSIALGAFEVTPLEIAGAYTAFANAGKHIKPHVLRQVANADGKVLNDYRDEPTQVLRPELAYLMTNLMEGVINHGTGAGVRARGFSLPAAGKTGTSRDGWFAGYTKDLLVIVWVGFDDGRDLNLEGSRSALPIWTEFMKRAYEIHPPQSMEVMYFVPPSGIELVRIDSTTLQRATSSCTDAFEEAFIEGTAPSEDCPIRDWEIPGRAPN